MEYRERPGDPRACDGPRSGPRNASTSAVFAAFAVIVVISIAYGVPMSSARVVSVSGTGFAVA
jgi:hypothetical protein